MNQSLVTLVCHGAEGQEQHHFTQTGSAAVSCQCRLWRVLLQDKFFHFCFELKTLTSFQN